MKPVVISYSLTGNNDLLASKIAASIGAKHVRIQEPGKRTNSTIVFDMIFNWIPEVLPEPILLDSCDLALLIGPVWMGKIATPLRAYWKYLKTHPRPYIFISISGGADGPNPLLADELKKRTGTSPLALIDLHIADLLPQEPKPRREDTSVYKLTAFDVNKLTDQVMASLTDVLRQEVQ